MLSVDFCFLLVLVSSLNPRQEHFCALIVAGETAKSAYFNSFPRCHSEKTAEVEGCKLLKNPSVEKRISDLRWEDEKAMQSDRIATKKEILEFLTEVVRTPAGNVDEEHKLCQSFKNTEGVREIKIPDKIRAVERMAKIQGWDKPEELKHSADDAFLALLDAVRSRK